MLLTDEGGLTEVILLQVLHSLLGKLHGLDDNVIERPTGGRNGHVVLRGDGAQVSEASQNALQLTRLHCSREGVQDSIPGGVRLQGGG